MCAEQACRDASIVDVVFHLSDARTVWGESLRVVGAAQALGAWAPEEGVALATDQDIYPLWQSGEVRFRAAPEELEPREGGQVALRYKYVRDRRALGEGFAWEEAIEDREVVIPAAVGSRSVWLVSDAAFNVGGPPGLLEISPQKVPTPPISHAEAPERTPEPDEPGCARFEDAYCLVGAEPFAQGGFSSVWRCRSRREGAEKPGDRAVKRIDKVKMPDRGRRFLYGHGASIGEVHLQRRLCHPNVVELLEVFDEPCVVSLVMVHCRGGDLLEVILGHHHQHGRGLPELAVLAVARQLLAALAFIHAQGIVHRDVKAENVLQLEGSGTVPLEHASFKLGDFGLAARVGEDEMLLEQVGSPSTSAPELVRGRPYAKPADVWSAGATLFTAVAARRPYEAASYAQMLQSHNKGRLALQGGNWDAVSGEARGLIGSLLQPPAVQRPTAAAALQHPCLQR